MCEVQILPIVQTLAYVFAPLVVGVHMAEPIHVAASMIVGADMAAIVETDVRVSASMVVGADMAAAVETDVNIPAAVVVGADLAAVVHADQQSPSATMVVGADMAAAVETDAKISAPMVVGADLVAVVRAEQDIPAASMVVGAKLAAVVKRDVSANAPMTVGAELAATIQRNQHVSHAALIVGADLAATVNRNVNVLASPHVGAELAATVNHVTANPTVVLIRTFHVSGTGGTTQFLSTAVPAGAAIVLIFSNSIAQATAISDSVNAGNYTIPTPPSNPGAAMMAYKLNSAAMTSSDTITFTWSGTQSISVIMGYVTGVTAADLNKGVATATNNAPTLAIGTPSVDHEAVIVGTLWFGGLTETFTIDSQYTGLAKETTAVNVTGDTELSYQVQGAKTSTTFTGSLSNSTDQWWVQSITFKP